MTYKKIRELGKGGFGVVDLVEAEDGSQWARKTLVYPNLPGISKDELTARFEREVKYQSQVNYPNVVRINDHSLDVDPPWFTMELATCSLADELIKDRTLGGDPRKPIFDILAGLEAIHLQGYKHRDLKPANVLRLEDAEGNVRYAISDFGLMSPGAGQTSTLTVSNMAGGTAQYAAPECATNFKRATTQSDIYSVGAILHDIFGGGAHRIPHTELTLHGPLHDVISKCTKTNLRRRYSSVTALREDLYELLTTEEITFVSVQEEAIVGLLRRSTPLTDDEWDRVFQQIDENLDRGVPCHAIFRALSADHLNILATTEPGLFASLGSDYAAYAMSMPFDFDYCDVMADKAQIFYDHGELDLKAKMAIALLRLWNAPQQMVRRVEILEDGRPRDIRRTRELYQGRNRRAKSRLYASNRTHRAFHQRQPNGAPSNLGRGA